jgi:hypothetical protein
MENWITLMSFTYPLDAHMAKGFLESEGVETMVRDELTAQVNNFYSNAIGGVKLLVKEDDYEKGKEALQRGGYLRQGAGAEPKIELVPLDKTTNRGRCPFCHSENIGKKKEPNLLTVLVFFLLGAFFPIFRASYTCFDCEKAWRYTRA